MRMGTQVKIRTVVMMLLTGIISTVVTAFAIRQVTIIAAHHHVVQGTLPFSSAWAISTIMFILGVVTKIVTDIITEVLG